jgi:hypothetical protein
VAGSAVDAALTPRDTVIGPALVAIWCAATTRRRDERTCMAALATLLVAVTIVAIADQALLPLPEDAGGEVRAAALGLLLATAAVLSSRARRAHRAPLM